MGVLRCLRPTILGVQSEPLAGFKVGSPQDRRTESPETIFGNKEQGKSQDIACIDAHCIVVLCGCRCFDFYLF